MVTAKSAPGLTRRRSTRVSDAVLLTVSGSDGDGQPFTEQTGTVEVSSRGCRYFSRYAVVKDSWLTIEVHQENAVTPPQQFRARVAWARKSRNLKGMFQVGVEFETAGNIWGLADPPPDWAEGQSSREAEAAAFDREIDEALVLAETGTYYEVLHVTAESSSSQLKRSYYELVRKFHPDRHMDRAEWLPSLQRLMDSVTLAYKTLTDETLRKKYDARLAESGAFSLGTRDEQQRTAEECLQEARQCSRALNHGGAILWLRRAIEVEPQSAKYHALLARSLSLVPAMRREAIDHCEKALELDRWNTAARLQLGELYGQMNLPWRARAHYQEVLEYDADNRQARELLQQLDDAEDKTRSKRGLVGRIFRK